MSIDYEKEYDNRGRVPEHPEIFARWSKDAADYRSTVRGAELGARYGQSPRQTIDIFPGKDAGESSPLALFIHGGYWRSLEPAMFSHMAAGPNANGVSAAVVGYDLCPQVTVAAIIEQVRAACLWLWRNKRRRFAVYGHSAGGHLAACIAATDFKTLAPEAPADLVPAAYAISGVFDLTPLLHVSQNQDLKLDETAARAASPVYWRVPTGRTLDAVVGALESSEFLRQSRIVADAWRQGMAHTRYEEIAGANHFTIVGPLADPGSAMTRRVCDLARAVNAIAL